MTAAEDFDAFYRAEWGRLAGSLRLLGGDSAAADVAAVISSPGPGFQVGNSPGVVSITFFTQNGTQTVLVGIGPDPAMARTVLRTLSLG